MKSLALIAYSLSSVARNRRRTISAIVGAVLAVSFIAGVGIANDSTSEAVFDTMLRDYPADFSGEFYGGIPDIDNATDALAAVNHIKEIHVTHRFGNGGVGDWNQSISLCQSGVIGVRQNFERSLPRLGMSGDLVISNHEVTISEDIANCIGASSGSWLYLEFLRHDRDISGTPIVTLQYWNFSVASVLRFTEGGSIYQGSIFVDIDDWQFYTGLFGDDPDSQNRTSITVMVDWGEILYLGNPDLTRAALDTIGENLELVAGQNRAYIYPSFGTDIVGRFNSWYMSTRIQFLAYAIPALALGAYLGLIGAELGLDDRRRELGILKARGMGTKQVFGVLMFEIVVLGAIAGLIGLFLGVFSSRLIVSFSPALTGIESDPFNIQISWLSVLPAILLAMGLLVISDYRVARRSSKITITESLQKYSVSETRADYRPRRDIAFLALALFAFIGMLFILDANRKGILLGTEFWIIGVVIIALTPFSPLFLVVGLTGLLTRGTTRIYDGVSRAIRFITKDLWYLVNRGLVRNPRKVSRVCMLISMGLAFCVFVSAMSETEDNHISLITKSEIGGDVKMFGLTNLSFISQMKETNGVSNVCGYARIWESSFGHDFQWRTSTYALNVADYRNVVHPEQIYFIEGDASSSLEKLVEPRTAIVTERFAQDHDLEIGDEFPLILRNRYLLSPGNWTETDPAQYELRVVAIVMGLPGFQDGSEDRWYEESRVFVDFSTLNRTSFGQQYFYFFIDVEESFKGREVGDRIRQFDPLQINIVGIMEEELSNARTNPVESSVLAFLMIEVGFSLLMVVVGLGLIMYAASLGREGEFASIIARGGSSSQTSLILLGEAITIIIIGATIGIFTGLVSAYVFNELFGFLPVFAPVLHPLIVSYQTLAVIMIAVLALFVAVLLATWRIRSLDVPRVLRKRGG